MYHRVKVGALLRDSEERILIFEEKCDDGTYRYNIPKGTFDPSIDATLTDALQREVFEETGIMLSEALTCVNVFPKFRDTYISLLVLFETTLSDNTPGSNIHIRSDEDIRAYHFMSEEEFASLNPDNFIDERLFSLLGNSFQKRKKS